VIDAAENPWVDLPAAKDFVLPADEPHVSAFHRHEVLAHHFRLDLPPDPWLGRWDAPVVILLQNPSFDDSDAATFTRPDITAANRYNLAEAAGSTPHYWLDDVFADTYSGKWWRRTLARLVAEFGAPAVARSVAAIEMYGYRTRTFRALPVTLPSQRFALRLVEEAMAQRSVLLLPRAARLWEVALPALATYDRLFHGRSRNAIVSEGNLAEGGFHAVTAAIADAP
jgi:hypothetical protein